MADGPKNVNVKNSIEAAQRPNSRENMVRNHFFNRKLCNDPKNFAPAAGVVAIVLAGIII